MSKIAYSRWQLPAPPTAIAPGNPAIIDLAMPTQAGLQFYISAIVLDCIINLTLQPGVNNLLPYFLGACFSSIGINNRILGDLIKGDMTGLDIAFLSWLRNNYSEDDLSTMPTLASPASGTSTLAVRCRFTIPIGYDKRYPRGGTDFALNSNLFTSGQDQLKIQIAPAACYAPFSAGAVLNSVQINPYALMFSDPRVFYPTVLHYGWWGATVPQPGINPIRSDKGRQDPTDEFLCGTILGSAASLANLNTVLDPADGIPTNTTPQQILDDFMPHLRRYPNFTYPMVPAVAAPLGVWAMANILALPIRYQPCDYAKLGAIQALEGPDQVNLGWGIAAPATRWLESTVSRFDQSAALALAARAGIAQPQLVPFTHEQLDYDGGATMYYPRFIQDKSAK